MARRYTQLAGRRPQLVGPACPPDRGRVLRWPPGMVRARGSRCSRSSTSRSPTRPRRGRSRCCAASRSRLAAGRSLALTGESGSGKTHAAAPDRRPRRGGRRHDPRRRRRGRPALPDAGRAALRREAIGLVFQQFNLIPSLDVAANLAFQARLAGRLDPAWQAELVDRLGLGDLLARYPEQLSGGQQQRVAIGRALAGRARPDPRRRAHRQPRRGDRRRGDGAAARARRRHRREPAARHPQRAPRRARSTRRAHAARAGGSA